MRVVELNSITTEPLQLSEGQAPEQEGKMKWNSTWEWTGRKDSRFILSLPYWNRKDERRINESELEGKTKDSFYLLSILRIKKSISPLFFLIKKCIFTLFLGLKVYPLSILREKSVSLPYFNSKDYLWLRVNCHGCLRSLFGCHSLYLLNERSPTLG